MGSKYKIGYYYEKKVIEILEKDGWDAWRTPGSHSPVDVIAIKNEGNNTKIRLIQVKATSNNKFDFNSLSWSEKSELLELGHKYLQNPYVSIELWIFYRKEREGKIIDIKQFLKDKNSISQYEHIR